MIDVQWFTESARWVKPRWARGRGDETIVHVLQRPSEWCIVVTLDGDRATDEHLVLPGWVVARIAQGPCPPPDFPRPRGMEAPPAMASCHGGQGRHVTITGGGGGRGLRGASPAGPIITDEASELFGQHVDEVVRGPERSE